MQLGRTIQGQAGLALSICVLSVVLSGCGGGGGGGPAPTSHTVTISWAANREAAVSSPGGGYKVAISGQGMPIDVPYASGVPAASTVSATTTLLSGSYSVTVTAYSALNSPGSSTGSTSAPSTKFDFSVP